MAENSNIEWCHHTFNPWMGCTKVSAACDNCYAENMMDTRFGQVQWGPHGARRLTSAANWKKPAQWNKRLEGTGRRERVFCASLADVFDNHKSIQDEWRVRLFALIEDTPNLDWLLLTKRPQNIGKWEGYNGDWPDNIWLGTSVENQEQAEIRIPHLIKHHGASVRFLSCEPLLGKVNFMRWKFHIDWVIVGGENSPQHRPMDEDWVRYLRNQCVNSSTPFLFKQWHGNSQPDIKSKGREVDGVIYNEYPLGFTASPLQGGE